MSVEIHESLIPIVRAFQQWHGDDWKGAMMCAHMGGPYKNDSTSGYFKGRKLFYPGPQPSPDEVMSALRKIRNHYTSNPDEVADYRETT
jgi:hypothetical protein